MQSWRQRSGLARTQTASGGRETFPASLLQPRHSWDHSCNLTPCERYQEYRGSIRHLFAEEARPPVGGIKQRAAREAFLVVAAYRMSTNELGSWIEGYIGALCASVLQGLGKKGTLR
jgi:hypothetical protein